MACAIETVAYPSWWESASTVQINIEPSGTVGPFDRADVELLPQGVAWAAGVLVPWASVRDIQKVS